MKYSRFSAGGGKMRFAGRAVLVAVMVFGFLTAVACSRAPEDLPWFKSEESGLRLDPDEIQARIDGVDCLFRIHDMKRDFILQGGDGAEAVLAALDGRRDQLVEKTKPFPAVPGALDFFAWRIRPASEIPGRQWERDQGKYEISGYFVVTGEMDKDWIFKVMTQVDDQHVSLLPPDRQQAKYLNWQVFPRTSTWEPGEHHILSTIADLQPIPYYIFAQMYIWPERVQHGVFAYGWFADPDLPPLPEDKPAPQW